MPIVIPLIPTIFNTHDAIQAKVLVLVWTFDAKAFGVSPENAARIVVDVVHFILDIRCAGPQADGVTWSARALVRNAGGLALGDAEAGIDPGFGNRGVVSMPHFCSGSAFGKGRARSNGRGDREGTRKRSSDRRRYVPLSGYDRRAKADLDRLLFFIGYGAFVEWVALEGVRHLLVVNDVARAAVSDFPFGVC